MTSVRSLLVLAEESIAEHKAVLDATVTGDNVAFLDSLSEYIDACLHRGQKVILCGNGGSASDALHIAAEFTGRFQKERQSLSAMALNADMSAVTAIGNDYGFDKIFSRQLEGVGRNGDVFIPISTSGNSLNVLNAIDVAKSKGMSIFGFTGKDGGEMVKRGIRCFVVPSHTTARIQEMHIMALHIVCQLVDARLSKNGV